MTVPSSRLAAALAGARDTRAVLMAPGAVQAAGRLFAEHFPGAPAVIVCDPRTRAATGGALAASFAAAGVTMTPPLILDDPGLAAEIGFVDRIETALRPHAAVPVAVGGGTINDLVKLAAPRAGRASYLCVATAASMDGYTAFGASITAGGAKRTFDCPAPRVVVADLDVIARAPPGMTAAGYADLLAKVTAGADWLLAEAVGAEPVEPRAWATVQDGLRDALADPAGARAARPSALAPLVEGLLLGGLAMQHARSSRPASGAEHQFSHLWDMEHHTHAGAAPAHGFKVGVATHAVARLFEALLRRDLGRIDPGALAERWAADPAHGEAAVRARFSGTGFVETALAETRAKQLPAAAVREQLTRLRDGWPALRERLRAQLLPADEIRTRLVAAGAPTEPEQIGIRRTRLREAFLRARHVRRRFTVLDAADRAGLLASLLDELFGPGGAWAPVESRTPASLSQ